MEFFITKKLGTNSDAIAKAQLANATRRKPELNLAKVMGKLKHFEFAKARKNQSSEKLGQGNVKAMVADRFNRVDPFPTKF